MDDPCQDVRQAVAELPVALERCVTGQTDASKAAALLRTIRDVPVHGLPAVEAALRAGAVSALSLAATTVMQGQVTGALPPAAGPNAQGNAEGSSQQGTQSFLSDADKTTLLVRVAQALANFSTSGPEGAEKVWFECWDRNVIQDLLSQASDKVHEPTTMLLYTCCKTLPQAQTALLTPALRTRLAWATLLQHAVQQPHTHNTPPPTHTHPTTSLQQPASTGTATAAAAAAAAVAAGECSDWLLMLVQLLAIRQGQLRRLVEITGSVSVGGGHECETRDAAGPNTDTTQHRTETHEGQTTGSDTGQSTHTSTSATPSSTSQHTPSHTPTLYSPLTAVLLYIVAHEIETAKTTDLAAMCEVVTGQQHSRHVGEQSNGRGVVLDSGAGLGVTQLPDVLSTVLDLTVSAAQGCGGGGDSEGESEMVSSQVLEACFECLKALVSRPPPYANTSHTDTDTSAAPGTHTDTASSPQSQKPGATPQQPTPPDIPTLLCTHGNLLDILLAMLACLESIQAARRRSRQRVPSASVGTTEAGDAGAGAIVPAAAAAGAGAGDADDVGRETRAALPTALVAAMPRVRAYPGYRADVLCVLSNVLYGRAALAESVARVPGAVTLLLSQCQLDSDSPIAKEYALWTVRNLCAGSSEACSQLAALQPVGAVNTPELQAMGMRIELDSLTGKFKMVRTSDAPQRPSSGPNA